MSSDKHVNLIIRDEHEPNLYAKRTSLVSSATIYAVVNTSATEPIELDASEAWIGFATVEVANASSIGLATVSVQNELSALATVNVSNELTALATVSLGASVPAGTNYIGLASVNVGNTVTVDLGSNNDVSLNAGTNYIGLATVERASSRTYLTHPIAGNTSGNATVFVPTGTFKIVHFMLNANATVGVNIKSGPTYLTGNASISVTLFPGGGWVENGDELSPVYDGLADAGSFVIETDSTTEIAGKVIYFED